MAQGRKLWDREQFQKVYVRGNSPYESKEKPLFSGTTKYLDEVNGIGRMVPP